MYAELVDRYCKTLSGSEPEMPFGPDVRVWTIGGRMFAIHIVDGNGVSVACPSAMDAQELVQTGRAVSPPYLKGEGWVLLPFDMHGPDDLRGHIRVSYDHVRLGLPAEVELALPPAPEALRQ